VKFQGYCIEIGYLFPFFFLTYAYKISPIFPFFFGQIYEHFKMGKLVIDKHH